MSGDAGELFERYVENIASFSEKTNRIFDEAKEVVEAASPFLETRLEDILFLTNIIAIGMDMRDGEGPDAPARAIFLVYMIGFRDGLEKGKADASGT